MVVFVALAAVVVYNVFHFHGERPGREGGGQIVFDQAAVEVGLTESTPNWASGAYHVRSGLARNPFTGRLIAEPAPAR